MGVPGRRTVDRKDYAVYIRSGAWKAVKARYRQSRLPQCCVICGNKQFDLHHRTYKNLGSERLMDIIPLCREHHDSAHLVHRSNPRMDLWKATKVATKRDRKHQSGGYEFLQMLSTKSSDPTSTPNLDLPRRRSTLPVTKAEIKRQARIRAERAKTRIPS